MLLLKLGKLFFKYPMAFLRNLNGQNILKFLNALNNEPKSRIGQNLEFFLRGHERPVSNGHFDSLNGQIDDFISELTELQARNTGEIVLFVSHEATLTGAPLIVKQIAHDLQKNFQIIPIFFLLKGGRISGAFRDGFLTYQLADHFGEPFKNKCIRELLVRLTKIFRLRAAYVNSAESRFVLPVLKEVNIDPIIMLVHEMGNLYEMGSWNIINTHADHIVFPCKYVMERAFENNSFDVEKVSIRGQGLLKPEILKADRLKCRKYVRKRLRLSEKSKIVLACGTPIPRKGIDIFVLTAISVLSKWTESEPIYFVWLGDAPDNEYQIWSRRDIEYSNYADNILLLDAVDDTVPWFVGSDLFFLTSRGDPFPCVVHEALAAGLQVVGFNNSGGINEMLPPEADLLNAYGDIGSASQKIISALQGDNTEMRESIIYYSMTHLNFLQYSRFLYSFISQDALADLHSEIKVSDKNMLKEVDRDKGVFNDTFSVTDTQVKRLLNNEFEVGAGEHLRGTDVILHHSDTVSLLNKLFPNGLIGKSILDLGCGSGEYSFFAHRMGADYVLGLDVQHQLINQAQSLKIRNQINSYEIDFQLREIYNITDLNEDFDISYIKGLFDYAPFPLKALSDICSATGLSIILEMQIARENSSGILQLQMKDPPDLSDGPGTFKWLVSDLALLERIFFWNGFRYFKCWKVKESGDRKSIRILASRKRQLHDQDDLFPKYRDILRPRKNEELPIPPPSLMYYGESQEGHLIQGKREVDNIKICLERAGYQYSELRTVLEFGCNNCRLLRWFYEGDHKELWGCDVHEEMITWCEDNLGHVINLQLNDHDPPLDHPDNYFDLVFAGSIFTHIDRSAEEWIDELARVTRPGGLLYLTYLDENSMRILVKEQHRPTFARITNHLHDADHVWRGDFQRICIPGQNGTTDKAQGLIICHSDFIRNYTNKGLELVYVMERAYAGYQTAYLFKKISQPDLDPSRGDSI